MKKYWQLLSMFTTRYLTYRARVFIWIFTDSAQYLLFPFLWVAIFATSAPPAGYSVQSLVTYYIMMAVVSTGYLSHCARHVRTEIHNGIVSRRLSVPFPYFQTILMAEISYKVLSSVIAISEILLLFIFGRGYLYFPDSAWQVIAFIISILFTFIISHIIQFIIGLSSIWFGDIKSIQTLEEIVNSIFSGRLAPLAFLPFGFQAVANYLPFKYLAFIPAQIFVGQIPLSEVPKIFLIGLLWIVVLAVLTQFMWSRGLKRYEGGEL